MRQNIGPWVHDTTSGAQTVGVVYAVATSDGRVLRSPSVAQRSNERAEIKAMSQPEIAQIRVNVAKSMGEHALLLTRVGRIDLMELRCLEHQAKLSQSCGHAKRAHCPIVLNESSGSGPEVVCVAIGERHGQHTSFY